MSRAVALLFVLAACRSGTPPSPTDSVSTSEPVVPAERPQSLRPPHDAVLDPICDGADVALVVAALDERCAISGPAWETLAAAPSPGALRQEAAVEASGVVFRLTNRGTTAIELPVRIRPGRPDLAAFSVLAEDDAHGVYELAAPHPELPSMVAWHPDGGIRPFGTRANPTRRARDPRTAITLDAGDGEYVHSARIRVAPGGAASVRLAIDPTVVKRLDPTDAAAPNRVQGHVILHIGQILVPYAAGEPARIEMQLP